MKLLSNSSAKHKIINLELKDIYFGNEQIEFNNRHPIFKTLMKLEFEEVLRKYHKSALIEWMNKEKNFYVLYEYKIKMDENNWSF